MQSPKYFNSDRFCTSNWISDLHKIMLSPKLRPEHYSNLQNLCEWISQLSFVVKEGFFELWVWKISAIRAGYVSKNWDQIFPKLFLVCWCAGSWPNRPILPFRQNFLPTITEKVRTCLKKIEWRMGACMDDIQLTMVKIKKKNSYKFDLFWEDGGMEYTFSRFVRLFLWLFLKKSKRKRDK